MITLNEKKILTLIFALTISGLFLGEFCVAPVTVSDQPKVGPEIAWVEIDNNPWILEPQDGGSDPYTGEKHPDFPGQKAPRGNITITIKNHPFTPYMDNNGNNISIYYTFWWKLPNADWVMGFHRSVYQSTSTYTTITFSYGVEGLIVFGTKEGGSLEFRVQEVTGYFEHDRGVFEGEGSAFTDFSVKIPSVDEPGTSKPNIQPSSVVPPTSDTSNPSPQNPCTNNLLIIITGTVLIITIFIAIIMHYLKRKNKFIHNSP